MRKLRVFIAGLVAAGVTFGLFLFMFKLISLGGDQRTERLRWQRAVCRTQL